MREIDFSEWQEQKRSYLKRKALLLSELSPGERVSKRPRDEQQLDIIRKADKERAERLAKEGRMLWTGPRKLTFKLSE